jgi:hypothetical protein
MRKQLLVLVFALAAAVPAFAQQPVQTYVYDGSVWRRLTFGTAGSPSTQVITVQGITSGTPFTVAQPTGTNLHVVCDSGCSSSAGFADNAAFTFGTTAINPIGGVLDDVATNAATENSAAVARITAQKALHINLRNATGTEIGTNANPVRVDPTGSTTQPVSGTVAVTQGTGTNLHMVCDSGCSSSTAPADNSAFTAGTTSSTPISGFYHASRDTLTDGRIGAVALTSKRAMFSTLEDASGVAAFGSAGTAAAPTMTVQGIASMTPLATNLTQVSGATQSATNPLYVRITDGTAAVTPTTLATHDGALGTITSVTGNVTMGRASAAAPTDVSADGDAAIPWLLRSGASAVQQTYAGVLATTGNGVAGTGVPRVTIASDSTYSPVLAAGANLIGSAAIVATATTTNATTPCYITSAATNNATNCKASAGNIYGIQAVNTTATLYFLRLYNLAASPTCSSATGFVRTIPIPASVSGNGFVIPEDVGEAFGTGIGFCLTAGGSSTDNTSAATGVYLTILYK